MDIKNILVHTCCAPCASASGERLITEGWEITLFYSNSNIFPEDEYLKRLESAKKLSAVWEVPLIHDSWDHEEWQLFVKGHEKAPEGGDRCSLCFEFNLRRTAQKASELGFANFTTTLTLGPFKDSKAIFSTAAAFEGFRDFNFKKKNGFLRSLDLSRKYNLYRQVYCGCEFSIPDRLSS